MRGTDGYRVVGDLKNTDFIMHHINRLAPGADGDPNKLFCALAAGAAMQ